MISTVFFCFSTLYWCYSVIFLCNLCYDPTNTMKTTAEVQIPTITEDSDHSVRISYSSYTVYGSRTSPYSNPYTPVRPCVRVLYGLVQACTGWCTGVRVTVQAVRDVRYPYNIICIFDYCRNLHFYSHLHGVGGVVA